MFIGPKIVSKKHDADVVVSVRMIHYRSHDPEFQEVETDYRGNTKFSTMISKVCDYGPRSDFVVRIIGDLLLEDPEKQMMVLAHNRSLLKYLYEAIQYRIPHTTVGYYLGGMKQRDLTSTEGRKIVLATYAMAAEALDIKTLSTLLMISPKTDITQSVGRILRMKHENPIIVDIVDEHEVFRNQARKRRTFYKKSNYRIREIDSDAYRGMALDWKTDRTWKRTFDPSSSTKSGKGEVMEEEDEEEDSITNTKKCFVNFDIEEE
jgi:hypothetical protein